MPPLEVLEASHRYDSWPLALVPRILTHIDTAQMRSVYCTRNNLILQFPKFGKHSANVLECRFFECSSSLFAIH